VYGVAQNWQRQKSLEICQKEGKIFLCHEESDFSVIEVVNEHFILTWSWYVILAWNSHSWKEEA